jgi:hypothetical protein
LEVANINDGQFEAWFIIDIPLTSAFRPPVVANRTRKSLRSRQVFQFPRRPGLQLTADPFGRLGGSDNDMEVIRSAIDCVQGPLSIATGFSNLLMDSSALLGVQPASIIGHYGGRFELPNRVREARTVAIFDPTPLVARKPGAISAPGDEVGERRRERRFVRSGVHGGSQCDFLADASGWCGRSSLTLRASVRSPHTSPKRQRGTTR